MSTYIEYVENRLKLELEEEETRKNEAETEDYEAALARLGVET